MIDKQKHEEIENIMNSFNFHKVAYVMSYLGWHWAIVGIPSITELKATARQLLHDVAFDKKDTTYIATGGFKAEKIDNKHLSLYFIIEEAEV